MFFSFKEDGCVRVQIPPEAVEKKCSQPKLRAFRERVIKRSRNELIVERPP